MVFLGCTAGGVPQEQVHGHAYHIEGRIPYPRFHSLTAKSAGRTAITTHYFVRGAAVGAAHEHCGWS